MAKKSVGELKALLEAEKSDAMAAFNNSTLSTERSDALDYYRGDMGRAMPTLPDRSKAVSTDVADTVEGLMPSLMEIFTAADEVVVFEPVGQEDEEAAKQETDYVNHVFMQKNPGFIILYDFIKDALLQKNGFVKVWWEVSEKEERETYLGLSDDMFAMFADDETVEIVEHSEYPDDNVSPMPPMPPMDMGLPPPDMGMGEQSPLALPEFLQAAAGQAVGPGPSLPVDQPLPPPGGVAGVPPQIGVAGVPPPMLHDVTMVKRTEYGCARVEAVPPEEFGIARQAKSLSDCDYCFHETVKGYAGLVALGFDEDALKKLPTSEPLSSEESQARDTVEDTGYGPDGNVNEATRAIKVTEHYVRMDYDGTGARLYRVTTGGDVGEVLTRGGDLAIDEIPVVPFASMSPIRMPHRFFGQSMADVTMDIQRIKTALLRGFLDNIYRLNNGRTEVPAAAINANTIDDLLDNRPGGIVRTAQGGMMREMVSVPIGDKILPALDYLDAVREWRTGVTRQGQGIDADALQNQTATSVNKVFSASQARMRLVARLFAETGIKDMFSLLHATIRMNETQEQTVRLRNKWVTLDPRQWRTRSDMTINVGIGTGNKEQRAAFLMSLLEIQKEALMSGTGLATPTNLYNTLAKYTELGDFKSPEPYFTDPAGAPPQEPKPDPGMAKVQAQAEAGKAELQMKGQMKQAEMQMDGAMRQAQMQQEGAMKQAQMQQEAQLELQKMRAEFQLSQQQMQAEMALEMEKMQAEMRLEMIRLRQDGAIQMDRSVRQGQTADRKVNLSAVRPGGQVG